MCMRCWDDRPACPTCNPNPPVYHDPSPFKPYKAPKPKKPRKADKHYCNRCRKLQPRRKVRWDTFVEAWECKDEKACNKRIFDKLPEETKAFFKYCVDKRLNND